MVAGCWSSVTIAMMEAGLKSVGADPPSNFAGEVNSDGVKSFGEEPVEGYIV